jgi:hypothetical protein
MLKLTHLSRAGDTGSFIPGTNVGAPRIKQSLAPANSLETPYGGQAGSSPQLYAPPSAGFQYYSAQGPPPLGSYQQPTLPATQDLYSPPQQYPQQGSTYQNSGAQAAPAPASYQQASQAPWDQVHPFPPSFLQPQVPVRPPFNPLDPRSSYGGSGPPPSASASNNQTHPYLSNYTPSQAPEISDAGSRQRPPPSGLGRMTQYEADQRAVAEESYRLRRARRG